MRLIVETRHRLGKLTLDAAFWSEGGVTALFGRSGSGKTSLVNIIAGLVTPDEGRVVINGEVITDTHRGILTPPHRRRCGYVFQDARLFPHMSVRSNLLYGRWLARTASDGTSLPRIVELLGIEALLDRMPHALSGGEKQRVAIGRALLCDPRLLLMDEPLAALDDARKAEILPYLERLRDETMIPIVYVSHAVSEVARLANTVVVLENGKVIRTGDAAEVLSQQLSSAPFQKSEAGVVIEGIALPDEQDPRLSAIRTAGPVIRVPHRVEAAGKSVRLHIAARDVMLATVRPEGISALNVLAAHIVGIGDEQADQVDIRLDCGGVILLSRITGVSCEALGLTPGMPVFAIIKSVALDR